MINRIRARFHVHSNIIGTSSESKNKEELFNDEDENKHQWDRPIEFLLSLISNSVGLGNVWRFPYLAASNGGGAFLIPYFILYFLIGAPLYYMELALGQFTSRGPGTGFVMSRGMKGVGIAMIINSVLGTLYYNVIIAWALFYFILSFRSELLWSKCGNWWNTERCFEPGSASDLHFENGSFWNCTRDQYENLTAFNCVQNNETQKVTVAEEFYYRLLLDKSSSFDDFGTPGQYMTPLLLVSWLIICLCIIRGVQSTGKVAYFTAIFPYVVLLVLIIFTATLEGAGEGIKYYIIPKWDLLKNFRIWQSAASQVFFSLSLSFGSLIAYSAANKFENNFFKQMCIVVSCDCFTGVFAGFAVFATIGFLATSLGDSVDKYAEASGPGLAFITYPEALSKMPASPFFSIIFFMMLLALGLGSQFASTDVIVTVVMEIFPRYAHRRSIIVIIACTVFFLCSLPFACPGGIYLFEVFQEYTANTSLVVIGFFEVISIALIYGFQNFMNDIEMMLGRKPAYYYAFLTWCVTAPILTLIITIANLVTSAPLVDPASGGFVEYEYPEWSNILGWLIFTICIFPIPLLYIVGYIREYMNLNKQKQKTDLSKLYKDPSLRNKLQGKSRWLAASIANHAPAETWGPRRKRHHYGRYSHLGHSSNDILGMQIINSSDIDGKPNGFSNPTLIEDSIRY